MWIAEKDASIVDQIERDLATLDGAARAAVDGRLTTFEHDSLAERRDAARYCRGRLRLRGIGEGNPESLDALIALTAENAHRPEDMERALAALAQLKGDEMFRAAGALRARLHSQHEWTRDQTYALLGRLRVHWVAPRLLPDDSGRCQPSSATGSGRLSRPGARRSAAPFDGWLTRARCCRPGGETVLGRVSVDRDGVGGGRRESDKHPPGGNARGATGRHLLHRVCGGCARVVGRSGGVRRETAVADLASLRSRRGGGSTGVLRGGLGIGSRADRCWNPARVHLLLQSFDELDRRARRSATLHQRVRRDHPPRHDPGFWPRRRGATAARCHRASTPLVLPSRQGCAGDVGRSLVRSPDHSGTPVARTASPSACRHRRSVAAD